MANVGERLKNLSNKASTKLGQIKDRVAQWDRRKKIMAGGGGLVLVAALMWLGGVFNANTPTVQAATALARRGDIRVVVSGTGTVSGILEQNLVAKVGGIITYIGFTKGSQVKQGDVILSLDNPAIRQKLAASDLSLRQSQFEYSQIAEDVNKLNVIAPYAGLITALNVKEGDEVAKGAPLVTVVNNKEMELSVPFKEGESRLIQPGQTVDVFLQEFLMSIPGRVAYVTSAAQPDQSGAVVSSVRIVIDNPGGLYPGIKAGATVHTPSGDFSSLGQSTLQYKNTSTIAATAAGTVTKVFVQQNDAVDKGQRILQVKSDQANTEIIAKQLQIQQSSINAQSAKEDSDALTIMAPFDGILVNTGRNVSSSASSSASTIKQELIVGDEVKAGDVVAKVANYDQMLVTIQVDEVDIPKVALGQKATITADALPNKKYQGEVVVIGAEGTTQNGVASFAVTIRIDQPEGIKAGMTVNADILVAEKAGALLVPIEALQDRQGKKFVTLSGKDGQDARKEVQVGLNNETQAEIISGLKEGDQVVIPTAQKTTTSSQQRGAPMPGMGGVRVQGR